LEPAAPLEVTAAGVDVAGAELLDVVVVEAECVTVDVDEAVTEKGSVAVVLGAAKDDVAAPEEVLENTKGTNVDVFAGVVVVEELAAAEDAAAELLEVVVGALEDVGASDGGANEVLEDAAPELAEVVEVVLWASVVVVDGTEAEVVGPADWNPSSS